MSIAIVSLACRYPEAANPAALWDNVLAGRRAFRALPPQRLDLDQYTSARVGKSDSITRIKAGLLCDWSFDCARFRIPQQTFEAADLTHWLALDLAADAIAAAGGIRQLDRDRTAVVVANTLTGEFSRASLLRLRAPFLDAVLHEALTESGLCEADELRLRRRFGELLRSRFPTPREETLAGGLANTIAGRIANYFDLHGGAYTVDGACASSLVAISHAADLLTRDDVDAVVVGGVDLSLDPFELVGFSRNGALATEDMRVFDRQSAGFWPGEGAGFAVLVRAEYASRRELPVLARLRGCGISTDGAGGFTRPSVNGQVRALERAHARAGTDPADLGYVEAHGTGTAVGDPVEVRALATLRASVGAKHTLPIGSIKANIGHTKAAAGFAGLIKAVAALQARIVPPHVGCIVPHPVFAETEHRVRPALVAEAWPDNAVPLAGVSAFGFGGINAHVVLEGSSTAPRIVVMPQAPRPQDAELFLFSGEAGDVLAKMRRLQARSRSLSLAELVDAAARAAADVGWKPLRAAVVAGDGEELAAKLADAIAAIEGGREIHNADGIALAHAKVARIGFLFPGQAAPVRRSGGIWARRFDGARQLLDGLPDGDDPTDTAIAQPTIVAASLAALRVVRAFGIEAKAVCGHSVGELTALAAAGVIDEAALVALAAARGAIMAAHAEADGGMLRVAATRRQVERLIEGLAVAVACENGACEFVIAGRNGDLERARQRAEASGDEVTRLTVSHAFHSPMLAPAVAPFRAKLAAVALRSPNRRVISTVTGRALAADDGVGALLARQIVAPVRFAEALGWLGSEAELLIEVGPGAGLTRLAGEAGLAAVSVDAFADTLRPLLAALGRAFVHGHAIDTKMLFADRAVRSIDLSIMPEFLRNPCGGDAAPPAAPPSVEASGVPLASAAANGESETASDILAAVRRAISEETGFAPDRIGDDDRFLDDLHLSSIAVGRIVGKAAQLAGLRVPDMPTEFANGCASEVAAGLAALRDLTPEPAADGRLVGIRPWVRSFDLVWRPAPPSRLGQASWHSIVVNGGADDEARATRVAGSSGKTDGVLIWLGAHCDEHAAPALFAACRRAWLDETLARLAICHAGAPVAAFARSLAAERRFRSITVVERARHDDHDDRLMQELAAAVDGFRELRIDQQGRAWQPQIRLVTPTPGPAAPLDSRDVVLVTGGAKGIAAECALRLASRTGAALILVGRSAASDPAVGATLSRANAEQLQCRYVRSDVADATALAAAVAGAAAELGPVTALLHAAGINEPARFADIDDAALQRVMTPKTAGLRAAVAAAGPALRRVIVFGSILGRIGLQGEAHYALANACQTRIAEALAAGVANLSLLCLEWSIWNGAGMGHQLGSIERLARQGVDAIALDQGVEAFERLVQDGAEGSFIVTGRFGPPRYVTLADGDLPIGRFVDRPLVHYPGLELVVETELSMGRDPYLDDHRIDGMPILPGVVGLEAMAQVACALKGQRTIAAINAVRFSKAIAVPERSGTSIRILTLAAEDGSVECAIRVENDGFALDYMRAVFQFAPEASAPQLRSPQNEPPSIEATPLYGPLLFQGRRFQRIAAFSRIAARRIDAALLPADEAAWFGAFEAQDLVLGDPARRDALLHALQAAVPHLRVVPVAVERIALQSGGAPVALDAVEIAATSDTFTFDIKAYDAAGLTVEHWLGASFRAIAELPIESIIAAVPQVAAAYLERVARASTDEDSIEVALVTGDGVEDRRARALAALDLEGEVHARLDGKPILLGAGDKSHLSISHSPAFTLAVKARRAVACDIEPVTAPTISSSPARDCEWTAATERLWTRSEVALKQDLRPDLPYTSRSSRDRDVVVFENAFGRTATIRVGGLAEPLMVAIGTLTVAQPVQDRG